MTDEQDDWGRVAAALEARMGELQLTIADVEREGGASFKTIQKALAGEPVVRRDALRKIAVGVKWAPNAIDRILRGEGPVVEMEMDVPSIAGLLEQQTAAIAELTRLVEELVADGVPLKPRRPSEPARP